MAHLKVGKVPPALLKELLGSLPGDPSVILGPRVGCDAGQA